MDSPFDWDKLAKLLHKAKGAYSFNKFAKLCEVDAGHISKLLSHKLPNPPQPEFLRKIANNAQHSEVTYKALMEACGYLEGVDSVDNPLIEDELISWAIDPENREFLKFIYEVQKNGFPKHMIKFAKITLDFNNSKKDST